MTKDIVFIGDRQTGKTTAVVDWFLEDPTNRMILTFSDREADRLQRVVFDSDKARPLIGTVYPYARQTRQPVPRKLSNVIVSGARGVEAIRGGRKEFVVDEVHLIHYRQRMELLRNPFCVGYTVDPEGFVRSLERDFAQDPMRIRDFLG